MSDSTSIKPSCIRYDDGRMGIQWWKDGRICLGNIPPFDCNQFLDSSLLVAAAAAAGLDVFGLVYVSW